MPCKSYYGRIDMNTFIADIKTFLNRLWNKIRNLW